jgi:hypothetical protein
MLITFFLKFLQTSECLFTNQWKKFGKHCLEVENRIRYSNWRLFEKFYRFFSNVAKAVVSFWLVELESLYNLLRISTFEIFF